MNKNELKILRKIPILPVVFSYPSDNETMPMVAVTTLHNDDENPSFSGYNINYIPALLRPRFFKTYERAHYGFNVLMPITFGDYLKMLLEEEGIFISLVTAKAFRRYCYSKISLWVYRGIKQKHGINIYYED